MARPIAVAVGILAFVWASPASADPCEGPLPAEGAAFSGTVRYVGDGDSQCIGPAGRPDRWIEIRLADFYAPELRMPGGAKARSLLSAVTKGQSLSCRAGRRSFDRVVAWCRIGATPVGDILRARGGVEGGRGYRRAS